MKFQFPNKEKEKKKKKRASPRQIYQKIPMYKNPNINMKNTPIKDPSKDHHVINYAENGRQLERNNN